MADRPVAPTLRYERYSLAAFAAAGVVYASLAAIGAVAPAWVRTAGLAIPVLHVVGIFLGFRGIGGGPGKMWVAIAGIAANAVGLTLALLVFRGAGGL